MTRRFLSVMTRVVAILCALGVSACLGSAALSTLEGRLYQAPRPEVLAAAVGALYEMGFPVAEVEGRDSRIITVLTGAGPVYYRLQVSVIEDGDETTVQPALFFSPTYRDPMINAMRRVPPREHPGLYRDFFIKLERRLNAMPTVSDKLADRTDHPVRLK